MKLYRVYYEEQLGYEDYVEARDAEQAKVLFLSTLYAGDIKPVEELLMEFTAEEAV